MKLTFILFFASFVMIDAQCIRKYTDPDDKTKFVCVCTETDCDDIEPVRDGEPITMYTSSLDGDRLTKTVLASEYEENAVDVTLELGAAVSDEHPVIGFGGAMTDATVININKLPAGLRDKAIDSYFGPSGLRYNIIRVPIASCDFSTREYSYLETPDDFELKNFSLAKEDFWKIEYINQAIKAARKADSEIQVFGSPWSAPAWMKTNGHMKGGGKLKNGQEYDETYAKYLTRFIEEYAGQGVDIWALTVQNEPSTGTDESYHFQTMYFSAVMERDFVRDYLKPALTSSPVASKTKIMIFDDFRANIKEFVDTVLEDPTVAEMVDGIAVHWYGDDRTDPDFLTNTSIKHPNHFILSSEACVEGTPVLGLFHNAIRYASDIIEDLNHRVSGWVDWNLVLDVQGGPNWVANYVDSPLIIAPDNKAFYKQPLFYAMGHFSRFVARGARRVSLTLSSATLQAVAFINPDRSLVIVLLNPSTSSVQVGVGMHSIPLKATSINTIFIRNHHLVPPSIPPITTL